MVLTEIQAATSGVHGEVACNWDDDTNKQKVKSYSFQLTGTFTGNVVAEVMFDGTNWVAVGIVNRLTNAISANVTSAGAYMFTTEGAVKARLNVTRTTGTLVIRPTTAVEV